MFRRLEDVSGPRVQRHPGELALPSPQSGAREPLRCELVAIKLREAAWEVRPNVDDRLGCLRALALLSFAAAQLPLTAMHGALISRRCVVRARHASVGVWFRPYSTAAALLK